MLVFGLVAMVLLDDLIEESSEGCVRVVRSSVNSNSRVKILASGEDGLLEVEAVEISLVLKLGPDIISQELRKKGGGSSGEDRLSVAEFLPGSQVGANFVRVHN